VKQATAANIPAAPILSVDEFIRLPQVHENKQIIELPYKGVGKVPMQGFPLNYSATPAVLSMGPPNLGEHNDEILLMLGFKADEINEFSRKGVI
jgi:crotonobetainyl-CoA:carnitine CoA-transferase CaiB-like acyl-CoA transferase